MKYTAKESGQIETLVSIQNLPANCRATSNKTNILFARTLQLMWAVREGRAKAQKSLEPPREGTDTSKLGELIITRAI